MGCILSRIFSAVKAPDNVRGNLGHSAPGDVKGRNLPEDYTLKPFKQRLDEPGPVQENLVNDDINYSHGSDCSKFLVVNLPTELLVKIFSYLSTSEKITMQYVCQRFQDVSKVPLLWKKFIVHNYEPCHLNGVKNMLKLYGENAKKIFFPVHVAPTKIMEMIHYCQKATHLCLPEYTQLSLDQLDKIVHAMSHLKQLDMHASGTFIHVDHYGGYESIKALIQIDVLADDRKCIEGLLKVAATSVRELNLRVKSQNYDYVLVNIRKWANKGYLLPSTINIFTDVYKVNGLFISDSNSRFEISLYDNKRIPLSLYHPMPLKRLQFGPEISPFIRLSDHGIVGLKYDIFYLNGYDHYGTIRYTVTPSRITCGFGRVTVNYKSHLHSISYIDISSSNVHSDHLLLLADLCPNLQRLNLKDNTNCLESLQGLCAIGYMCQNLKGLNLAGISVLKVESYVCLWEILSSTMKLTHLAIDICMVKPFDSGDDVNKQKLINMFKVCHSLQALEIHGKSKKLCSRCNNSTDLLFLQFPSLKQCRISSLPYSGRECVLSKHHQLRYLYAEHLDRNTLEVLLSNLYHLQQLYINLSCFDLTDELAEVLSANGGLECVVLYINSITINGIRSLINNSPNLTLLHISISAPLFSAEDHLLYGDHIVTYKVRKLFSCHKLFTIGSFYVQVITGSCLKVMLDTDLCDTNLNSLWPTVGQHTT